ncbi:UNVERIFIED_CONTAM: putative ribonuclease H protein [Sesamum radiatum]|uniref:Ribonuclease H protein n=1 Tax=Sesamum radiatum TaxID=300843 RepID=A0AAW2WPH3_SESRA
MAELLDRDWEAEKKIDSSSKTTFHNEEGNLGGLDHELRSTSKLKATGKASRRSPKSGDKDSKSTTATGTRILLRGECSNRRQRNKLLSEMDIIEIQATLEASEIEAQDIQESSDKDEAVTLIFNRFQSLEDSNSLLELDPELQVIPNSTDSTPGDYIHDQGLDSGILPQPQAQVGEHEINQNVNVKSLESNLQEHILEESVISNRLKRNNSMEDNSIKTGKAAGKGKKNKGNSAARTLPKRHTRTFYSSGRCFFHSQESRRALWEELKRLSLDKVPWIVGGDFNTMQHTRENRGGTISSLGSIEDYNAMVLDSGLTDAGFEGEPFTWSNKRLYRLKDHLKQWNRDIFGNVFSLVDQAKAATNEAEKQFDRLPSEANLINLNRKILLWSTLLTLSLNFGGRKATANGLKREKGTPNSFIPRLRKEDVFAAVTDFFRGTHMPRSFTTTSIILILKNDSPQSWSKFRPISLCNVTNKILSKLLYNKISQALPDLISPSQSGFVPGRLIADNILLAQEMTHHLDMRHSKGNLILKLDMSKAYDRVKWKFLYAILKKMGFPPRFIALTNMLLNTVGLPFWLMENHLVSSNPHKVSDKNLDMLYQTGCKTRVAHLAYADDIIIFTRCEEQSLNKLMQFLDLYENQSGQGINHSNSFFTSGKKANLIAHKIKSITGFNLKCLPITYLGAPLHKGHKKKILFEPLIDKIRNRISGWENRHLSQGGRLQLIKSVLSSMPIYLLQVLSPPAALLSASIAKSPHLPLLKLNRRTITFGEEYVASNMSLKKTLFGALELAMSLSDRGWFKLNTDGVSKGNPGVAGAGGIIRNHLGQTVLAFQEHLGLISNTATELKAIYRGVKLCIDSNIRKIWVETDANVALKLISSPSQGPWHFQNLLQQIRNLLSQTEFKISHIFREGNQVADYFANQAFFNQHLTILSPDNITGIPKGLIRLNACSFPAIRIRSISTSNFS